MNAFTTNRPYNVLLVEDDPADALLIEEALVDRGMARTIDQVTDGVAALQYLRDPGRERPDLIVLDIQMPRMDGLTAARRIRATGSTTPILMLTARDTVGDRVTGLDAGADDYLVKPFELDELFARIRALLRRSSYAASAAGAEAPDDDVLSFADLRMDLATREVTR
uniref:response regulator transcription factor n=1 Tax=Streptomyces sp. NRRL WC-3725 TaxID=1463933 RepID=UPI0005BBE9F8